MVKLAQARALKAEAEKMHQKYGESAVFEAYMNAAFDVARKNPLPHYTVSAYYEQYNSSLRKKLNLKKQRRERIEGDELYAVTQLFTPRHLAEYITDNSLGRLIKRAGFNADLPFLDGGIEGPPVQLEDIRIFDPACGTGNMLFYAYLLLYSAYQEKGIPDAQIKKKLKHNIVGFDIDPRAASVARRVFSDFFLADITILSPEISLSALEVLKVCPQLYEWVKMLSEMGSISRLSAEESDYFLSVIKILAKEQNELDSIANIITAFSSRYDAVLMNPPYLSSADYGSSLKEFIFRNYPEYKADLFSVFIARAMEWKKDGGYIGVVCPYNWMFIKQFIKLRQKILNKYDIINLAMLPPSGYRSAVVYLSAFVLSDNSGASGRYLRLSGFNDPAEAIVSAKRYIIGKERFALTPYNALIFWTGENFIKNYKGKKLSDYLTIRQGMATGDNARYLRKIAEVNREDISFDAVSIDDFSLKNKPYALYNKGGEYRKWYGNIDYVILFNNKAREELSVSGNKMPSRDYYFKPCITWTLVSSKGHFGARISSNSVFDVGGSCGFPKDPRDIFVILAYLCSNAATYYLNAHNPTLNCQVGDIKNLPYIPPSLSDREIIERLTKENIALAKADWEGNPIAGAFIKTKENEELLNRIFNKLYGLESEVSPLVPERLITLKNKGDL